VGRQFLIVSFVLFLVALVPAYAATNCAPPINGDWTFNSTNSTLVCDNGTAIVLNGSLYLYDNATATFANGTNLTATTVVVANTSVSLTFANSTALNATLNLSAGNATFRDGGTFLLTALDIDGFLQIVNTSLIAPALSLIGDGYLFASLSTLNITNNITLSDSALMNVSASTLLIDDGYALFNYGDVYLYNQSSIIISNQSTFRSGIRIFCANTVIIRDSALVHSLPLGVNPATRESIFTSWPTDCSAYSNVTLSNLTDGNKYYLQLIRFDTLLVNRTSLDDSQINFFASDSDATLIDFRSNTTLLGLADSDYVLENVTNSTSFFTTDLRRSGSVLGTFTNVSLGELNLYFQNSSGIVRNGNFSYLRIYPDSEANLSGLSVGTLLFVGNSGILDVIIRNVTVNFLDMNTRAVSSSLIASNFTVDTLAELLWDYDMLFEGQNNYFENVSVPNDSFYGPLSQLMLNGNITLGVTDISSFGGNQTITRVYPLNISFNSAPYANASVKVLRTRNAVSSAVWTGTTGANGLVEPNITFNSSNYNDTFYLFVNTSGIGQDLALKLLNDTPLSWTLNTTPIISTVATSDDIGKQDFSFNLTLSNDTTQCNYSIRNATAVWANGTWNSTQLSSLNWRPTATFDGIYLPAGTWTLTINASNGTAQSTTNATLTSVAAMQTSLTSASSASTNIGGSNVSFTFLVTVKNAGSIIKSYVNLTRSGSAFDTTYGRLRNSTATVGMGSGTAYTGSGNVTIVPITSGATPSYVALNLSSHLRQANLTITLQPYSSLVAGTYTGS